MTDAYAASNSQGTLIAALGEPYGHIILEYTDLRSDVTELTLYRGEIVRTRGMYNSMPVSYAVPGHETRIRELVPQVRNKFSRGFSASQWHDSIGVF